MRREEGGRESARSHNVRWEGARAIRRSGKLGPATEKEKATEEVIASWRRESRSRRHR